MARMLHLAGFSFNRTVSLKAAKLTGVAALTLAMTGCVSQDKYNALKLDRDGLAEQLTKAQSDDQSAEAMADSYKSQLAQFLNGSTNKDALLANYQQQISTIQSEYDSLNQKYAEAMQRSGTTAALPPQLTSELQTFATEHPDLVDFDAARGIVKFKSDVTFGVGDATLNPNAKAAITRFAEILNSPTANGYELMVAGHTDNQRVSNPRTIAAGNKDNWYLSCHRAISVGDELIASRVSPNRLAMVGYADQRPIASNASSAGQAANRRVEILILPTQVRGAAVEAADTIPARSSRHARKAAAMLNKDSEAPVAASMNK
jgi:chemotaxis protein MotB